jgi:hypothetical protein
MPHGQTRFNQRFLERKGASEHEAHQVIAPELANIGNLGHQLPVPPDPVSGQIGSDIQVVTERG